MNNKPFIIAELSANHNASLERALQIVDAAASCGCSAIKFQTYTADSLTLNSRKDDFMILDQESPWYGSSLYELYQKAATPYEWHKILFERARSYKMIPFSTPFDVDAVDFLETLGCEIYKIASFENSYTDLLIRVAKTKKPVIMSLGMIPLEDIYESVDLLKKNGAPHITLLKCTSSYPASPEDSNLSTILDLKKRFPDCTIGISDHTLGIGVALSAIGMGAEVIEKHFTLSRADGGVDSTFSLEPKEMKMLVDESEYASKAIGNVHYGTTNSEKISVKFRRSIYFVKDIKAGEVITNEHLRVVRPGYGAEPKYKNFVIGKKITKDCFFGDPLKLEDVDIS